ncbi:MAG TPA: hypothetical protein VGD88_16545 [Opitutaceae bacterium]
MKSLLRLTTLLVVILTSAFGAAPDEAKFRAIAAEKLAPLTRDPALVEAVRAQNALNRSLADIQAADKAWMATPGINEIMRPLIDSPVAATLRAARATLPALSEAFVMDKLGANVAMTDKTSDFWQGDEAKFTECIKDGAAIWIGKVEFDESSQSYSVQISLPVVDGGIVIGAVCFGLDVEQL